MHITIEDPVLRRAVSAAVSVRGVYWVVAGNIGYQAGVDIRIIGAGDRPVDDVAASSEDAAKVLCIGPGLGDESILDAARLGAWAYISEDASDDELIAAVDELMDGRCPILNLIANRPAAARELLKRLVRPEPEINAGPVEPSPLSARETEILARVAAGETSKVIASAMGFGVQTVKNQVTHILNKTGTRSRTQAATVAQKRGWIPGPD